MKNEKEECKAEIIHDPYEEIANAIIIQAWEDYKREYKKFVRKGGTMDRELNALERFFRSDWYRFLTAVDGEYLMERLRNDVLKQEKTS